ncbi:MAG: signal peptide peptidase SppA [Candidatus Krumholzibacteria bacterium]|nr:signal peptide peptidase SppA [Candidatus Krumholzibacteria bacterium]
MRVFLISLGAAILALILVFGIVIGLVANKMDSKTKIQDHSWLHIDLYGSLPEYDPPSGPLGPLTGGDTQTLQSVLTNLDMAANDKRIDGVVFQLSASNNAGRGKLEEIRRGIARVQASGKTVLAFADYIDLNVLYTAAACDSFFCPPSAYITIIGLDASHPHVKKALKKLGVEPYVSAIKDYKSAAQIVTRDDLTPEAIANKEWMLDEYMDLYLEALTEDRGIDAEGLDAIMTRAEFLASEALSVGIVDGVMYWDELSGRFQQEKDKTPRMVTGSRYAKEDPEDLDLGGKKKIAVIHAQGNIGGRTNGVNPLLGMMMGHESINAELKRALEDENVAAIVLRIDSGGGESLASDLMGHVVEVVSREKPVVVSMVDVAASGGYMMAYRSDWIVADNMTVTGSIGSISAKFDMSELYDKLGLEFSHVTRGPNARFMGQDRGFTDEEFQSFDERHNASFHVWVEGVAEHRNMTVEKVESLGQGRVWTGRQAVANGLTDEIGGLWEAVAAARRLAEIPEDTQTGLWHLPEKQDFLSTLLKGDTAALSLAGRWLVYRSVREDVGQVRQSLDSGAWQTVPPGYLD